MEGIKLQREIEYALKCKYNEEFTLKKEARGQLKNVFRAKGDRSGTSFIVVSNIRQEVKDCEFERGNKIQQKLFQCGFEVPQVIDRLTLTDNHPIYCHNIIEGEHLYLPSPEQSYNQGKLFSRLHNLSPQLMEFFKGEKARNYRSLPCGICHMDTNIGNIIYNGDKPFLIDFDQSNIHEFFYEINGIVLGLMWRSPKEEGPALAAAFLDGYTSIRPFVKEEKEIFKEYFPNLVKEKILHGRIQKCL